MSITNTVSSLTPIIRALSQDEIQSDGHDTYVYDGDDEFTLSEDFVDTDSITVFQNGTTLNEADWSYDSDTNQVEITPVSSGVSLTDDDIIEITYNYYSKWSDSIIKKHLKAALTYFAVHNYHKIFEVDSDDNIVTINGLNPEPKELYFIAMITSIHLDPQNVDIKVGTDFSITSNREKSDQEQISEAFAQFSTFLGSITFEEIERIYK